jgi:hypothetical protein
MPPIGTSQPLRNRTEAGPGFSSSGIEQARTPPAKTPKSPKRMRKCAGLASGPSSRPTPMCRLMSQSMPSSATSRERVVRMVGSATQAGTPVALPSRVPTRVRIADLRVRCR